MPSDLAEPAVETLDSIEDAVAAIAAGELVVVVDDTDRENEGDLIMAASLASPEKVGFMVRHTSGIICVPMPAERAAYLDLHPMVANNIDPLRTAFTVSVDFKTGLTTGISAGERTGTIRALAGGNAGAGDFVRPGHIFPLVAREGGVLARSGHTEAAVDLANLAGVEPAGVLAEIVNDDGSVKRLPELIAFAREHNLRIVSIEDLIAYRMKTETHLARVIDLPAEIAGLNARILAYEAEFEPLQPVAVVLGDVQDKEKVPCRIYREQPVSDLIGRINGANDEMKKAVEEIAARGRCGILIVLRNPSAMELPEDEVILSSDSRVAAAGRERHGSARARIKRWREVGVGAQILRDLGVRSISLLASSERQYVGLGGFGIEIAETVLIK
jgi:3,4-dihydroxy 2-butanone 4-phosphate synthase/GTP cyclohydrolase II